MLKLLLEETSLVDVEVTSGGFNGLWMLKLFQENSTGLVDVEVISGGFNRSCGC